MSDVIQLQVAEVHKLRFELKLQLETPAQILASLQEVRKRLDRVELVLVTLVRVRGRAHIGMTAAQHKAEDQWDIVAHQAQQGSQREYQGPRERYASFNVQTLPALRERRATEELHKEVDVAVEAVRTMHRGLDGIRNDLTTMLRAMSVQERLET